MDIDTAAIEEAGRAIWEGEHARNGREIKPGREWRSVMLPDFFWDGIVDDARNAVVAYMRAMNG